MVLLVLFYVTVKARDAAGIGDAIRALTYIENFGPLISWIPHDGWLSHTWSLAIEEQFYLVWPIVVILATRRSRSAVAAVAVAGIAMTLLLRHGIGTAHYFCVGTP
jgi:peptidoglycan/LPS O-acetylase OafA/YrhL